jgi:hypothetical protein
VTVAHMYTKGAQALAAKKVDFVNDTIVCALLDATYTPDQDGDEFLSDLTGELSGGSYARATLTGKTSTTDAGVVTLDCADVTFATFTADPGPRYAVFAVSTGVAGTSNLLCWMDFETATAVAAQPGTITIPAEGLITLTVS